jgi:hypothetical protein
MRSIFLLSAVLVIGLCTYAGADDETKDTDPKRWKNGFIVTLMGDTIAGKIKTTDFLDVYYDYQHQLAFKSSKGIAQYSPDQLKSFSYYEEKDSAVTLQSVSSPDGDGRVFLRLYYTGACKVYGFIVTEIKGASLGPEQGGLLRGSLFPTERKYIQIGGSQFFQFKRIGFKKNMKEIFVSCPHILSGLDEKKYTYENWPELVRDYNCGRK